MIQSLSSLITTYSELDYIVFAINFLLLIFAKPIIVAFQKSKDGKSVTNKVIALRFINTVLILLYLSALFIHDITKQISQTGLTFLIGFILVHFMHILILRKFGREKEIDEVTYRTETYQSEIFNLIVILIASITIIVLVINIWGLTDWLRTTSVLGILAIIIFSTKDVWAPDNINGLILLYNGDVEPGAVVRVEEYNLLAIAMQVTLSQTIFRDLRSKHLITIPNSKLRNCKVEILNKSPASGLLWFIDFNISYGVKADVVESFFETVWQQASEESSAINSDKPGFVKLIRTADHAVTWRFGYWVKNIYSVLETEFIVNKCAYELSLQEGIELATPLTHQIHVKNAMLEVDETK